MRLLPTEENRLLVHTAAQFAREALARGLRLSAPEATALITDEIQWAARAGQTYHEVAEVGRRAARPDQVLDGVPALLDEIRVEALFAEGTRLVVVRWPLGRPATGPGQVEPGHEPQEVPEGPVLRMEVTNTSARVVRVSSHHPFHLVNHRLVFDRDAAHGLRLDLPAGGFLRWGPGQRQTVRLIPIAGSSPTT